MNFQDYYESLKNQPTPAAEFVKKIADLCGKSEATVRKWLAGEVRPDPIFMKKISDYLNIPVDVLFPESMFKQKRKAKKNGKH